MAAPLRDWLAGLEGAPLDERLAAVAFVAGQDVDVAEAERNAALRRAALLLATGGDPSRPLDLHGRAVTAVARDLDGPERRAALAGGLATLRTALEGLAGAGEALRLLAADAELAWLAYACALLAEHLADD